MSTTSSKPRIVPRTDADCGIDGSAFSGVIRWAAIAERGFRFGVARIAYGAGADSRWADNAAGLMRAEIGSNHFRIGGYGFLRTDHPLPPQVDAWCRALDDLDRHLGGTARPIFWLDFEALADHVSPQQGIDLAAHAAEAVRAHASIEPMLYTYLDFVGHRLANCDLTPLENLPLVLARYAGLNAPLPKPPGPWPAIAVEQYAGNQLDPTLADGFLDLNVLGPEIELASIGAWSHPSGPTMQAPPFDPGTGPDDWRPESAETELEHLREVFPPDKPPAAR